MSATERLMASFVAALVASSLTTVLVSLSLLVVDPPSSGQLAGEIVSATLGGMLGGAVFGTAGAFVFLAPVFLIASAFRFTRYKYSLAGALAGMAHSILGRLFLTHADSAFGPWTGRIALGLGFLLLGTPRPPWLLVASAAILAGAVSGLVFRTLQLRTDRKDVSAIHPPRRIDQPPGTG